MRRAALAVLAWVALTGAYDPDKVADGPLESWPPFARLPPLADAGDNALRVRISPTFSYYGYVVDFAPQPRGCLTPYGGNADDIDRDAPRFCRDVLVTYRIARKGEGTSPDRSGTWTFHIPVTDYRALVEGVDPRLDRWKGVDNGPPRADGSVEIVIVSDGTSVGVERRKDGKVRSMSNNYGDDLAIGNPASFAKSQVQRLLLLYGPSGKVPRDADWNVNGRTDRPDDPCALPVFATPDPDGYGVGRDACAQALKRR